MRPAGLPVNPTATPHSGPKGPVYPPSNSQPPPPVPSYAASVDEHAFAQLQIQDNAGIDRSPSADAARHGIPMQATMGGIPMQATMGAPPPAEATRGVMAGPTGAVMSTDDADNGDIEHTVPPTKIARKLVPRPVLQLPNMPNLVREVEEMLAASALLPEDRKKIDTAYIMRYIRAEVGSTSKAFKRIIATVDWRKTQTPMATGVCSQCEKDHRAHDLRCIGEDMYSRPIMYNCFAAQTAKDPMGLLEHFIVKSEECVRRMGGGVETWVWICDFEGFGLRDAIDPRFSIWLIQMLQNHYPERLGACIVIDAPRIFSILWKAAKSVAASNTLEKCIFLRGPEARAAVAAALFGSAEDVKAKFLVNQMELNRDQKRVKATWGDPHMVPSDFTPVPFAPI
uniref:CRAL-TRIO domain-containing protein n=1 Tax=Hemiselmis andersenii TaxID=464988 RepID=A0A6T8PAQ3_HEMAN|mmetsp:Transcript_49524/g.120125  ORF Transcript_49524/g.120125 Transcript_49524/m.120125 type:complete len:397 (+) Transcript_49524:200-1390(+)|eukprot:CAMPEP_0114114296 /NCGR_PEP_ID=MMETSP0043_2-20121206/3361_1 /TAXON_ID=464988 /ORGANISM="Hemiselmis andersenii, Strain CCMP644" /LENGTH=396 /DNA_ID=CAMNT_0001206485 /DNA_START=181 /DNA_END=1371 /DNA_ORIENTATION=-